MWAGQDGHFVLGIFLSHKCKVMQSNAKFIKKVLKIRSEKDVIYKTKSSIYWSIALDYCELCKCCCQSYLLCKVMQCDAK